MHACLSTMSKSAPETGSYCTEKNIALTNVSFAAIRYFIQPFRSFRFVDRLTVHFLVSNITIYSLESQSLALNTGLFISS